MPVRCMGIKISLIINKNRKKLKNYQVKKTILRLYLRTTKNF